MKHVCVCICTYKRTEYLKRLLCDLAAQETGDLFTYSLVVVDNDRLQSAEPVVRGFAATSPISIRYVVEPHQNIALARNRAVATAEGDFIAFIDDDEFPVRSWLLTLFKACYEHGVDGVLGPVKPHFDEGAPEWVAESGLYDRPSYPTGFVIDWMKGRTGNVLLKREVLGAVEPPFRPQFRTGEDQDFFRRMIEKGHVFVWCAEAVAYESVPPARWRLARMLRKALLRGSVTLLHPNFGVREIAKSAVAVPAYSLALPFALLAGQHRFVNLLVKLFDHLGKLLAVLGLNPAKEPYVTD
jgi:glycosyltransferase involved in cell wall biosynthesis